MLYEYSIHRSLSLSFISFMVIFNDYIIIYHDMMEFNIDGKNCFSIPYKDIALSSANGKNEVAFEFTGDAE